MRRFPFFLIFLFFLTSLPSAHAQATAAGSPITPSFGEKIFVPGIHNAGKVSQNLFRGAQPNLSSFAVLKQLGITTVVDLRGESRGKVAQERREAEALGLRFVYIPVGGFSPPTDEQLARFFALLKESPRQTIFVHCALGEDRTGVFIASYRIAFQNWSSQQALSEMLAFGFNHSWHPAMAHFVRDLPARLHSDPVLKSALAAQ